MRRITIGALALVLGCAVLAQAAEPKRPAGASSRAQAEAPPPPTQESVDKVRTAEFALYQERDNACLKLREIAIKTGDTALEQKALKMADLAFEIYQQRLNKLPVILGNEPKPAETMSAVERRSDKPTTPTRAPNGRLITSREANP